MGARLARAVAGAYASAPEELNPVFVHVLGRLVGHELQKERRVRHVDGKSGPGGGVCEGLMAHGVGRGYRALIVLREPWDVAFDTLAGVVERWHGGRDGIG